MLFLHVVFVVFNRAGLKRKKRKKVGEKHLNETANCGTISNMAKGFKNATLALALTAVGVVASCRASGASPDISRGGVDILRRAA